MNQKFRHHRYPTAFQLIVTTPSGKQRAAVIDVNQGGARLEGLGGVKTGDRIVLHALNEQVTGVIRWVVRNRVGVSFAMPARAAVVDMMRQAIRPGMKAGPHVHTLREMRH